MYFFGVLDILMSKTLVDENNLAWAKDPNRFQRPQSAAVEFKQETDHCFSEIYGNYHFSSITVCEGSGSYNQSICQAILYKIL